MGQPYSGSEEESIEDEGRVCPGGLYLPAKTVYKCTRSKSPWRDDTPTSSGVGYKLLELNHANCQNLRCL